MKKQGFVFAGCFFLSLGINILGLSLVYLLADRFSFNAGQIGLFMALGQVFYFTGCNLSHRLSAVFGPLAVITVASAVAFAATLPLGHARSVKFVYAAFWVVQLCGGTFWPPVMGWLTAGLDEKKMNSILSVFNRTWMSANVLGPLLAGRLYQWNTAVCFAAVNLAYLLAPLSLCIARRLLRDKAGREPLKVREAPAQSGAEEGGSGNIDKAFDLYRYRGWLTGFCSAIFVGILGNIVPLHIRDGLGYTEQTAGMVLFIRCLFNLAGFALLSRFTRWHFRRGWFFIAQGALIFSALLFFPAGNRLPVYFTIAITYGLFNSVCYTNSIFYSGATGKNPRKNLAFHEIFLCIGGALGSAGGGLLYQRFMFTGTCLALTAALCAGMGLLVFLDRKETSSLLKARGAG